eukprot:220211_1
MSTTTQSELDKWYATLRVIQCSALIVSPVLLCICFPAQKYIAKFQKELLVCSLGTICAFCFLDIIPVIIKDANHHGLTKPANKIQLYLFSCTILIGMLFAAFLGCLHNIMEHKHCEQNVDSKEEPSTQISCLPWIPPLCRVIWIGTALHNLADGMILGLSKNKCFNDIISAALPLFIHEIMHTLCNVNFYITLGMSKCNAIILRIGSCVFVFIGSLTAHVYKNK